MGEGRLPIPQGNRAARKAHGLEAALVDNQERPITSLEAGDQRTFTIPVAGPAALVVAKAHKLKERLNKPPRLAPKDALDILRLLQAIDTSDLAEGFRLLRQDARSAAVTQEAQHLLRELFGTADAEGTLLIGKAVAGIEEEASYMQAAVILANDLLDMLEDRPA